MSEYGYIPDSANIEQSFGNNKGIFTPKDIYDLTRADKWTTLGALELIETKTASGVNIVDFTDLKTNLYNVHFATISASINNTGSVNVRFFENGVIETASVYQSAYQGGTATGSFDESKSTTRSRLFATKVGASGDTRSAYNYFYNLGDSAKYSYQTMQGVSRNTGTTACDMRFGSGVLPQASTVDGIRFTETGGGLLTGSISLYGIRYT